MGAFEQMSFDNWLEDVQLLAAWLSDRSPRLPLLLHGLGMGGTLAGLRFHEGIGDALLLWSPVLNANKALRAHLAYWAGLGQLLEPTQSRLTASGLIRQLEQGSVIEVEGYLWSGRLWRDSFAVDLPLALAAEELATQAYKKPVRVVQLGKDTSPLIGPHPGFAEEATDLTWLYAENFAWIASALELSIGGKNEASCAVA
jgi:hypothetical protein